MLIMPRRRLIHATLQPIHQGMQTKPRHQVHVRVPNTATAVTEYRESAALLRQLGCYVAATLLEATAAELQSARETPEAIRAALNWFESDRDNDTVVADVDDVETLNNVEIPA